MYFGDTTCPSIIAMTIEMITGTFDEHGNRTGWPSPHVEGLLIALLVNERISLIAVDEADVLYLSKTFRPSLSHLGEAIAYLTQEAQASARYMQHRGMLGRESLASITRPLMLAVTATPSHEGNAHIASTLELDKPLLVSTSLHRPRVDYRVEHLRANRSDVASIVDIIKREESEGRRKTLTFFTSKTMAQRVHDILVTDFGNGRVYIATRDVDPTLAAEAVIRFLKPLDDHEPSVHIQCTSMAARGLDAPDVDVVITVVQPSLADLQQPIGRVARGHLLAFPMWGRLSSSWPRGFFVHL